MSLRRAPAARGAIGMVAVIAALFVCAAPVAAECTRLDRWPSFRDALRSARTIVVGEVIDGEPENWLDTFTFRVDEVLRGTAPQVMQIHQLRSGLPLTICPSDSFAYVMNGDHLALALGALAPNGKTRIDAIAYVQGSPDSFLMPGVERIPVAEVRELAGLPSTDALADDDAPSSPTLLVLLSAVLGVVLWLVRSQKRSPANQSHAPGG